MTDSITGFPHLDIIADEIGDEAGTCDADYAFQKAAARMIHDLRTALEAAEKALLKEEVYSEEIESQLQDAESEYNANWAVQAISDVARLVGVYEQCSETGNDIGAATLEAVQDLKGGKEQAEAERDAALSRKEEAEASLARAYNQISQQSEGIEKVSAANHDLANKAQKAEAENARLTAQLAALTGQQEDCKLHPCPYSREGLSCGVISLANNRAHEGMVENMRLTAERDWLANRLACIQSAHDIDPATKDWGTDQWQEAARRAVAGEGEVGNDVADSTDY